MARIEDKEFVKSFKKQWSEIRTAAVILNADLSGIRLTVDPEEYERWKYMHEWDQEHRKGKRKKA